MHYCTKMTSTLGTVNKIQSCYKMDNVDHLSEPSPPKMDSVENIASHSPSYPLPSAICFTFVAMFNLVYGPYAAFSLE